jgi:hypothetical protein
MTSAIQPPGQPAAPGLPSSTRTIDPKLSALLQGLRPGQRIRITQTVRVGLQQWTTTVTGKFRALNYLVTGLATDRVQEDAIVVVAVHFEKEPHGELSSITVDEHTQIEALGS